MHYEINVSRNGRHFFATHPRSLLNSHDAETAYRALRAAFPEAGGYAVECSIIETSGKPVYFAAINPTLPGA